MPGLHAYPLAVDRFSFASVAAQKRSGYFFVKNPY